MRIFDRVILMVLLVLLSGSAVACYEGEWDFDPPADFVFDGSTYSECASYYTGGEPPPINRGGTYRYEFDMQNMYTQRVVMELGSWLGPFWPDGWTYDPDWGAPEY